MGFMSWKLSQSWNSYLQVVVQRLWCPDIKNRCLSLGHSITSEKQSLYGICINYLAVTTTGSYLKKQSAPAFIFTR